MKTKLLKSPNEILSTSTQPVDDITSQVIPWIAPMRTLLSQSGAVAISANQVGHPYRFFVDKTKVYINPTIEILNKETISGQEGCLSLPGGSWICKRYKAIKLTYETTKGKEESITISLPNKLESIQDQVQVTRLLSFQHEVDHLNGTLISNHGSKVTSSIEVNDEPQIIDARGLPIMSLTALQARLAREKAAYKPKE